MKLPIACTLTQAEIRERRAAILDPVRTAVRNLTSVPLGTAYHFDATSAMLAQLAQLVDFERQCCPFLTFTIVVAAGNQTLSLEVSGPAEAEGIIADFFGSSTQKP